MNRVMPSFAILLMIVGAIACTSTTDPGNGDDPNLTTDNSFVVNGNGYNESLFKGYSNDEQGGASNNQTAGALTFNGETGNSGETFALSILVKSTDPGTYPVNSAEGNAITLVVTVAGQPVTYFAGSGSIEIESWGGPGGTVKGTFTGTLVDLTDPQNTVIQVTAGKFTVNVVS